MIRTEHMSLADRFQRIGELLSKGITLMHMREADACPQQELADPPVADNDLSGAKPCRKLLPEVTSGDETDISVMDYLTQVRSASPREIGQYLQVPRRTVSRRLQQLQVKGLVCRTGQTRSVRYRINMLPDSNGNRFHMKGAA
jgi:DNA-binding transcriptional ArsR family regulator